MTVYPSGLPDISSYVDLIDHGGPPGGLPLRGGSLPDGALPHLVEPPEGAAGSPDLPVIGDGIPDVPET